MAREEAGPGQEAAVVDWGQRRRARTGSLVGSEGRNGPRAGGAGAGWSWARRRGCTMEVLVFSTHNRRSRAQLDWEGRGWLWLGFNSNISSNGGIPGRSGVVY